MPPDHAWAASLQACAAQANVIFQEIVASSPELGGTGVGLAGISAIDKEAVDRALTKAVEVAAAADGAGGAVNAPKTIPHEPPGSVILQGNDPVCGVACTAMTISDAHGGTVSLADTIGSFSDGVRPTGSISMKYQRSSLAMAFKIPPMLC